MAKYTGRRGYGHVTVISDYTFHEHTKKNIYK